MLSGLRHQDQLRRVQGPGDAEAHQVQDRREADHRQVRNLIVVRHFYACSASVENLNIVLLKPCFGRSFACLSEQGLPVLKTWKTIFQPTQITIPFFFLILAPPCEPGKKFLNQKIPHVAGH